MRPTMEKIIERQLELWKRRAWYPDVEPEKVEKDGKMVLVDNPVFNGIFSGTKFSCIYSENKEEIYRILRYGIEKGKLYNSGIIFVRRSLFDTYICPDSSFKDSYNLCNELIDIISPSFENKFVVCDDLNCDFNDKLACYFISQLQKKKASGVVFSCNNKLPNTLYSCIKTSGITDIIEI